MEKNKRVFKQIIFIGAFSFLSFILYGSNAPVTTIASVVNAIQGEQVSVPITVNGFNNIGGFTLALDYEYAKLHFVSGTNNSFLGGTCNIGDIDLGNGFHRLTISWYNSATDGISLADGSTIVEYIFTFISSPATLTWYDMGPSCVYNDPAANTLIDTPTSDYYFNGLVSDSALPKPSITANGPITFMEGANVTLTSSAALAYLWSTGDTTASIVVNTSGKYFVQTKDVDGFISEPSDPIDISVISIGSTQLNFGVANTRIISDEINKYFEFDIQVKADNHGTFLWSGQINLNFENRTLSSKAANWSLTTDSLFNVHNSFGSEKYKMDLSIEGSIIKIKYNGDLNAIGLSVSEKDFVGITNDYQTLVSVRGLIISRTGAAGIEFCENEMNGKQFCRISAFPWYQSYATVNGYNRSNVLDISELLTDIRDETFLDKIKIFVDPDKQIIINGNVGDAAVVKLYNLQGMLMKYEKLNSGYENKVNVSRIKSGIYVVVVRDNGKKESFKVYIKD